MRSQPHESSKSHARRRAQAGDPGTRGPHGQLRPPLGATLLVLRRQVPLRDRARHARAARSTACRDGRQRATRPPYGSPPPSWVPCRSRLRRRFPLACRSSSSARSPRTTGRLNAWRGSSRPATGFACSKTWLRPAAPPWTLFRRCARRGSSARPRYVSSIASQGGADALARVAVRLWPLFRISEFISP